VLTIGVLIKGITALNVPTPVMGAISTEEQP